MLKPSETKQTTSNIIISDFWKRNYNGKCIEIDSNPCTYYKIQNNMF
jgi:hypothetical protein